MSQVEEAIAELLAQGRLEDAAVTTLRSYGPEILGFIGAQLRNPQHADDVFALFAEDLWRALPALVLRTSMRAYAYALARNACHRFVARDLRRERRGTPLSQHSQLSAIVAEARSATAPYLATGSKTQLAALRDRLSADEQALLTLRLDRRLSWAEIAAVFAESGEPAQVTARLRKRFQSIKQKLTGWAEELGLLGEPNEPE